MGSQNFEDLEVWQLARELTRYIYEVTRRPRFSKDLGLVNQIRRASASIMSNIAEGYERGSNKELLHFLYIAKSSCGEVRSHLYIALDQEYISSEEHNTLLSLSRTISVKLNNFISAIKTSSFKGDKFK
jgi:four helix bundle protein